MARISVGLDPVQVAGANPRRHQITVQLLPNTISPGNTGLVFGKFGSAPVASLSSNTWDFVLNAGAADGSNFYDASNEAFNRQELWLVSDTAGQEVNVVETSVPASAGASPSGAAAG